MEPTCLHPLFPRRVSRQRPHPTRTLCLLARPDRPDPYRVLFNRNRAFLRLFLNTLTILWQPFQSWSNAPEGAYPREG